MAWEPALRASAAQDARQPRVRQAWQQQAQQVSELQQEQRAWQLMPPPAEKAWKERSSSRIEPNRKE